MELYPRQHKSPLPGADFLAHHHLLIDIAGKKLFDTASFRTTLLQRTKCTPDVSVVQNQRDFSNLEEKFPYVFSLELCQFPSKPSKHDIYHQISTSGPPAFSRFRRMQTEKLRNAKKTFEGMEFMGLSQKAASSPASSLHLVKSTTARGAPGEIIEGSIC